MIADTKQTGSIAEQMNVMGAGARRAAVELALTSNDERNGALLAVARAIRNRSGEILAANAIDMTAAKERGLSGAMLDRLMLDTDRIESMAASQCRWVSSASSMRVARTLPLMRPHCA